MIYLMLSTLLPPPYFKDRVSDSAKVRMILSHNDSQFISNVNLIQRNAIFISKNLDIYVSMRITGNPS